MKKYQLLRDKNNAEIDVGDILRITDNYGVYDAPVIFKDGMFTIDKYEAKQVKNQDGWLDGLKKTFPNESKTHDQVASYGFIVHWGKSFARPIMSYHIKELEIIKKYGN